MAPRNVRLWPDPVLTQMCVPVQHSDLDLDALITDLFDTMYAAKGRGLAAPQIGVLKRVFVIDVTWKEGPADPRTFINPMITNQSDATSALQEQCLSIPDTPMNVTRADRIQLHWETADGHSVNASFDGIEARCILHELDHLNGTVIFDHQTPDTRAELEAAYAP